MQNEQEEKRKRKKIKFLIWAIVFGGGFLVTAYKAFVDNPKKDGIDLLNHLSQANNEFQATRNNVINEMSQSLTQLEYQSKQIPSSVFQVNRPASLDKFQKLKHELESLSIKFDSTLADLTAIREKYNSLVLTPKDTTIYAVVINENNDQESKNGFFTRAIKWFGNIFSFLFNKTKEDEPLTLKDNNGSEDKQIKLLVSEALANAKDILNKYNDQKVTITNITEPSDEDQDQKAQNTDTGGKFFGNGGISSLTVSGITNKNPQKDNSIELDKQKLFNLLNNRTWSGRIYQTDKKYFSPTFSFENGICKTDYFYRKKIEKKKIKLNEFIFKIEYLPGYHTSLCLYKNVQDTIESKPYAIFKITPSKYKGKDVYKFMLSVENGEDIEDPGQPNFMNVITK